MAGTYEYETVTVDVVDGAAWVTLNRPEKRNAMNPTMHREMVDVLDRLEHDPDAGVVVLTGAGPAWCAGMDLKEFFRDLDGKPAEQARVARLAQEWRWDHLWGFPKVTIAMVNGYCFGGAFTTLAACDLALAAEDAVFGINEVNWGAMPAGNVSKAIGAVMGHRDALWALLTGDPFDGRTAERMRLVNKAVPAQQLRSETEALVRLLLAKSPIALSAAKQAYKYVQGMDSPTSVEYLKVKQQLSRAQDRTETRRHALDGFLDTKKYRPGLEAFDRSALQVGGDGSA